MKESDNNEDMGREEESVEKQLKEIEGERGRERDTQDKREAMARDRGRYKWQWMER